MKRLSQRLRHSKVKFDVCGMVMVDKTLLSSVRQIMGKKIHKNQKYIQIQFFGWLSRIKGHFKIILFSKYGLFLGSDQCNFVFGDRLAVQLQLNQISANWTSVIGVPTFNNSVDPRPCHVNNIVYKSLMKS